MNILITGGAGYIGSHVLKALLEQGEHDIVVIDNFYTGSKEALAALNSVGKFKFIKCDLSDLDSLKEIFRTYKFEAIMHFAAYIEVFESMQNPLKYYINNVANTANLINLAIEFGVNKFIFSSTAATYGEPKNGVVNEQSEQNPINPYGKSKLMAEWILRDAAVSNSNFKYIILRYFNVAGASRNGLIGQNYPNATHLIKIITQAITKKRDSVSIFGSDYETKDGTCIRDYIHVEDLANAHIYALSHLAQTNSSDIFNVGYGKGFSVLDVIEAAKRVSGVNFTVINAPRRTGDPAVLIADSSKLKAFWQPKYENLELIIDSALNWERRLK